LHNARLQAFGKLIVKDMAQAVRICGQKVIDEAAAEQLSKRNFDIVVVAEKAIAQSRAYAKPVTPAAEAIVKKLGCGNIIEPTGQEIPSYQVTTPWVNGADPTIPWFIKHKIPLVSPSGKSAIELDAGAHSELNIKSYRTGWLGDKLLITRTIANYLDDMIENILKHGVYVNGL